MAQRDLSIFRTVTQQVVKQPNSLLVAGVQIANQIVEQGQRSKMAESASQAQLEVSALQDQYQIDFQSDPMGGIDKYRNDRQGIYDAHFKGISPLFKRDWTALTRKIGTRNDAVQQAWALRQTRNNTIRSVNTSIKNALLQASNDGRAFGLSDEKEIDFFVNGQTHMENIRRGAEGLLGENDLNDMLGTGLQDYVKTGISSTSETNPIKAAQLLKSDLIAESFNSPEERSKMTKAVNARALNFQEIQGENETLNIITDNTSLLARSVQGEKIGYAPLLAALEGKSKFVRDFFMRANGYKEKGKRISPSQGLQVKADLYAALSGAGREENLPPAALTKLEDKIYQAMDNGALTKKEGNTFLNGLLQPLVENKKEFLSGFSTGVWNPFRENTGFTNIQDALEGINIPPPEDGELGILGQTVNNQNTVALFDFFTSALEAAAQNRGIQIGDLLQLDRSERTDVFAKAQRKAVSDLLLQKTGNRPPDGATFSDIVTSLENGVQAEQRVVANQIVNDAYDTRPDVLDPDVLSIKPETLPVSTDVGGLSDAELLKQLGIE